MSIGAAQVFSTVHRIAPGQRVLVVGADPLSLATTGEMVAAGVNVVGVVLPSGPSAGSLGRPTEVLGRLSQASALAPNLMLRVGGRIAAGPLRGLVARLARLDLVRAWGVPIRVRTALTEVIGGTEVEAVRLAPVAPNGELGRSRKVLRVDAVCTSGGLRPLADLAQLAGCQVVDVPQVGGQVPLHSRALETRLAGLFVAGNVVGIEGAPVALAQGRVAAVSAARYLEVIGAREAETALQDALLQVEVARRQLPINFLPEIVEGHRLVESMFADPPPDGAAAPVRQTWDGVAPDLIVCRCEEVTWAALRDAIEDGATSMPGLKKRTRVCMGQCQGRICEPLVRALASDGDRPLPPHRAQVPLRPIRFGDF
jgi:sarcosine oxidase subunit alpha